MVHWFLCPRLVFNGESLGRGYFPRGGGRIELHTAPLERGACLTPVDLVSKGEIVSVRGLVHVVDLPKNIAERMYQAAWKKIRRYFRRVCLPVCLSAWACYTRILSPCES